MRKGTKLACPDCKHTEFALWRIKEILEYLCIHCGEIFIESNLIKARYNKKWEGK